MVDGILNYGIAAASGAAGAVGAFYALRQKMVDLEAMVMRRLAKLENERVSVPMCDRCKTNLETKIDLYHRESEKGSEAARILAEAVTKRLDDKLDSLQNGVDLLLEKGLKK